MVKINLRFSRLFSLLILLLVFQRVSSQVFPVDTVVNKKRLCLMAGAETVAIATTFTGLYMLWYRDYPMGRFHSFNDNSEWLQMDKVGHATSSYFLGKLGFDLMRGVGLDKRNALIFGGGVGLFYLTGVEIMDGFSNGWGFSYGDMIANTAGAALFIGQQWAFDKQIVSMKFSYSASPYAVYRPELLGENSLQRLLKDYNGQTYWLSVNLKSFMPNKNGFPEWLNLAFGYGANGMLGGFSNPIGTDYPQIERYRQFYLSPDIDWTRIPVKNKYLKFVLEVLSFVKLPAPALEYGHGKFHLRALHF
ncbi:MAG: DUF2279 domain-containing protein [Bacteroidales bacterium]|nr:DUF2279 domain-containing protein [Bacteroidales bacterium]